jgi:hypothetical protein
MHLKKEEKAKNALQKKRRKAKNDLHFEMKEVYVIHSTNLFFCFSEKWQDVVIHTIRMTPCCISVYYFLQVLTKCTPSVLKYKTF